MPRDDYDNYEQRCPLICCMKIFVFLCIGLSVLCLPLLPADEQGKMKQNVDNKAKNAVCYCCNLCMMVVQLARYMIEQLGKLLLTMLEYIHQRAMKLADPHGIGDRTTDMKREEMPEKMIEVNKNEQAHNKFRKVRNHGAQKFISKDDTSVSTDDSKDPSRGSSKGSSKGSNKGSSKASNKGSDDVPLSQPHSETAKVCRENDCDKCSRKVKNCVVECPNKGKVCEPECGGRVNLLRVR